MKYSKQTWDQIKNKTADALIRALERDGWSLDEAEGSQRIYLKDRPRRRVSIHYHPRKTYGAGMLKALLDDIGWSEADLRRLKLIK